MKKSHSPITRVKNPEPNINSPDWVIWAAWADRITFEEIKVSNIEKSLNYQGKKLEEKLKKMIIYKL